MVRGRPGRASSSRPLQRSLKNRRRHSPTYVSEGQFRQLQTCLAIHPRIAGSRGIAQIVSRQHEDGKLPLKVRPLLLTQHQPRDGPASHTCIRRKHCPPEIPALFYVTNHVTRTALSSNLLQTSWRMGLSSHGSDRRPNTQALLASGKDLTVASYRCRMEGPRALLLHRSGPIASAFRSYPSGKSSNQQAPSKCGREKIFPILSGVLF